MTHLYLRPSSIPTFLDCGRRYAVTQHKEEIEALGHVLNEKQNNAGACVGTSVHEVARRAFSAKKAGEEFNKKEILEAAESMYESLDINLQYNTRIKDKDNAIKKINQLSSTFFENVYTEITPKEVELESSKDLLYRDVNFTFSGTADLIDSNDNIIDLKTGASQPKTSYLQYAGYVWLLKEKFNISSAVEYFLQIKDSKKRAWTSEQLSPAFASVMEPLLDACVDFTTKKDINAFTPNPSSMLCSKKFCPAFGTSACPLSKVINEQE